MLVYELIEIRDLFSGFLRSPFVVAHSLRFAHLYVTGDRKREEVRTLSYVKPSP